MADHLRFVTYYLGVASFTCQLVLLALAARTYRKTGHTSLLILAIGSVLAILYMGVGSAASLNATKPAIFRPLYAVTVVLFTAQAVLGVWGFVALFRAFAARHNGNGPHTPPLEAMGSGSDPRTGASGMAEQARTGPALASLFRLWTLRRPNTVAGLGSERSVLLLGLAALALWAGLDRFSAGPGASFDIFGIESLGLIVLMLLAIAYALARRSRPPLPFRQSLFMIAALLPALIVLDHFTDRWAPAATAVLAVYALIFLWRAMRTFAGASQPGAIIVAAALALGCLWLDKSIYLYPSLWVQRGPDRTADATWKPEVSEPLLFDQQHRIDQALSGISTATGPEPSVFFVGFAGVGEQKVFSEEIKLASRVVGQRFDIGHRQLLLINDRRDHDSYPLATVSGLRYALNGIARKMETQRDILFLSLSSHGSDDPELSVSNGSLALEQVTGKNLMQALHDSGIRWRIIVISACHAGAFIPILKDPSTIIITAAAADRTSFGCSDDRELTYFGEAFYRDALPTAATLDQAFATAKASIARREASEHITPSKPQAYFGTDLERILSGHPMREPVLAQN